MERASDTSAVARGWWDYQRRSAGTREERKALEQGLPADAQAARDAVERAVERGGIGAVELLAAIIEATPPGMDSIAVGAGPLEDLLHEHGDDLIDTIESYARQRPTFTHALSGVWLEHGHLAATTEQRLAPWIDRFTANS